jgi:hypothetical protein
VQDVLRYLAEAFKTNRVSPRELTAVWNCVLGCHSIRDTEMEATVATSEVPEAFTAWMSRQIQNSANKVVFLEILTNSWINRGCQPGGCRASCRVGCRVEFSHFGGEGCDNHRDNLCDNHCDNHRLTSPNDSCGGG